MSGRRLLVGAVVMGVLLPLALFFLLSLHTGSEFFTLAAAIFLTWGVADLLAGILEKPRLQNRTPTGAFREEFDRRGKE
jgi:hypothetical protein